ncbi:uncharacterized protein LOC128554200 [Mercenaria mercenaria]|uniref:uncharacterized protein LOC128554200 n=1 Tax=Mercenaria mercenaria TaxID=6596 RepID=UPI00234F1827|nr:uncharacterized protein LOC128554200 [Mercenaria mercenaria]XP_053391423.1 uncharacterized protein LOC128554200 [Mercenaria mercenaria]
MEIAMVVWIDDKPMTSGIIRLTEIRSPRKELKECKEGEIVLAKCCGFTGNHQCLLARIGDSSRRGEFQTLLGPGFSEILKEYNLNNTCNPIPDLEVDTHQDAQKNGEKRNLQSEKKPRTSKVKRLQETSPQKTKKKKTTETDLIRIANELELTELESVRTSSPAKQHHSICQETPVKSNSPAKENTPAKNQHLGSAFRKVTPEKRNCVGSVIRGGLLALDQTTVDITDHEMSPIRGKKCRCQEAVEALQKENESLGNSYYNMAGEIRSLWA